MASPPRVLVPFCEREELEGLVGWLRGVGRVDGVKDLGSPCRVGHACWAEPLHRGER